MLKNLVLTDPGTAYFQSERSKHWSIMSVEFVGELIIEKLF